MDQQSSPVQSSGEGDLLLVVVCCPATARMPASAKWRSKPANEEGGDDLDLQEGCRGGRNEGAHRRPCSAARRGGYASMLG